MAQPLPSTRPPPVGPRESRDSRDARAPERAGNSGSTGSTGGSGGSGNDDRRVSVTADRRASWRPRAQVRAMFPRGEREDAPVSDWASLFGDLARSPAQVEPGASVEWRIHDKTHLEFAIDYPLENREQTRVWEAYLFVPESFRIHEATYSKKAIFEDLQSYVRYAVPELTFDDLMQRGEGSHLDRLSRALERSAAAPASTDAAAEATRELRLWCCFIRSSSVVAMRATESLLREGSFDAERVKAESLGFALLCTTVSQRFRDVIDAARKTPLPDEVKFTMAWCDEAASLSLEAVCGDLALRLEANPKVEAAHPDLAERVAAAAVAEARHRAERGYDSVASAGANEREIEHLEFRRHVLKRFTASVLWLSHEVREGAMWVVHVLYAIAAAVAMTFAVFAALKTSRFTDDVFRYALLVVLAYAVKDRMKAVLQDVFNKWISSRFPDRLWTIRDRERRRDLGQVLERAGFVPFRKVPDEVLSMRRLTREHALEEYARPERVLWHTKEVRLQPGVDPSFPMLTEIFRLNIGHWLAHTDDPKRRVLFADPEDASIYTAIARRVYNVGVVYRLRGEDEDAPWHRIRVVVSRKGILRIEPIC